MRLVQGTAALVLLLAACAGGADTPVTLSAAQKSNLRLAAITADAKPGAMMGEAVIERITRRVQDEIRAEAPLVLAPPAAGSEVLTMKLIFDQYTGADVSMKFAGNDGGFIRINAEVMLIDAQGRLVADVPVRADFGSGGYSGLTTDIANVESDFAREVAALVR